MHDEKEKWWNVVFVYKTVPIFFYSPRCMSVLNNNQ
jgi:hypothetical protein